MIKKNIYSKYDSIDESVYSKRVANLIGTVVKYILMLFNVLIAFQVMWLDLAILMWWIAFWIWFAMETTFANIISAILLVTNPKIKTWVTLKLLWSLNCVWKIEKISARHSIIRLLTWQKFIIPNTVLSQTPIQTIAQEPEIRHQVQIAIDLSSDINKAKQVLRNAINIYEDVMHKDRTYVNVEQITDTWIQLIIYFYTFPKTQKKWMLEFMSDMRLIVHKTLKEADISIPYPHMVVNM